MAFNHLDWDSLRVFRVVAELGSMTAAASSLGESTPTVSRKIDDLEKNLGGPLVVRTTRGVQLTALGTMVLSHVKTMEDAADAIRLDAGKQIEMAQGSIRLWMGDGLGTYWVAPRIPEFQSKHPKVRLILNISEQTPDLNNNEADIAIQFNEPSRSDVIARRLGVLHYMAFATQDYLTGRTIPKSLFELYAHRCILHSGYVQQIERWAPKTAEMKQMLDFALVTNSSVVMYEVCRNGGGISILPTYAAMVDPDLIPLDFGELAPIQFWLTYTERVRRSSSGQAVIDWLKSIFDPRTHVWFRETFVNPADSREETDSLT